MSIAERFNVPAGAVPGLREFKRHVWSYRDENGSAICEPPWVYSVIFEDEAECRLALDVVGNIFRSPDLRRGRIQFVHRSLLEVGAKGYEVRFADLAILYRFLTDLALMADADPAARQLGEFLMWTLGFRWV